MRNMKLNLKNNHLLYKLLKHTNKVRILNVHQPTIDKKYNSQINKVSLNWSNIKIKKIPNSNMKKNQTKLNNHRRFRSEFYQ